MLRFCAWMLLFFLATLARIIFAVGASMAMLGQDPSAMAWVGFLPFLLPFFALEVAMWLGPVVLIVELYLFFRRRANANEKA